MAVKAIFFDAGEVLAKETLPKIWTKLATILGISPGDIQKELRPVFAKIQRGDAPEFSILRFLKQKHHLSSLQLKAISGCFKTRNFVADKRVYSIAKKLKAAGYIVGLISNTEPSMAAKNKRRGDYRGFHPAILSYEVKSAKPEPEIFETAAKMAGVQPEEMVFFDDQAEYAKAAKKMGIRAFVYKNPQGLIRSLRSFGVKI